ncbi:MAG: RIO1 family regulatory kinase/ATPase [Candidatus Promineifilaceae bacterium]
MTRFKWHEQYEAYDFNDMSRQTHRGRKGKMPKEHHSIQDTPWKTEVALMNEGSDTYVPTYVAPLDPKHHERQWVIDSTVSFYQDKLITDVTHLVKGGKEANVYCCVAGETVNHELLAAKLYRPRMLRTLKNNAIYKAGRTLRDSEGKEIKGSRELRAMAKKTRFGKDLDLTAWIEHEFLVQQKLHQAGADVPQPIAHGGNTILMAYLGDASQVAPTLIDVSLARDEAKPLFQRIMHNVELMLAHHLVHGDLSAYNILYWEGEIAIIDFPQVVDTRKNPHAFELMERDIVRVCQYFASQGVKANGREIAAAFWERYLTDPRSFYHLQGGNIA